MSRFLTATILILALLGLPLFLGCEEEEVVEELEIEEIVYEHEYTFIELDDVFAIVEENKGDYAGFGEAFERMLPALEMDRIEMIGSPFGVYFDDSRETPEEEPEWLLAVPVDEGSRPPRGYEARTLEGGLVVKTTLTGELEFEELTVYDEIYAYLFAHGYIPDGPMVIVYHWGPDREPADYETDFMVFVAEVVAEPEAETEAE